MMKVAFFIFATVALALGGAVLDLDKDTFDQAIKDHPLIMVEFFAPWCGHCKRLEPEYEKAAEELNGVAAMAKVNADAEINRPLASTYGIRGFPTLKIFRNGSFQPTDYNGERSAQALVSFMKRLALPAISTLSTSEDVETFSKSDRVVIVGFFDNADSQEYKSFTEAADTLRNEFVFGSVTGNSAINQQYGVEAPNVILFKQFDEGKNVLGSNKFSEIASFVKSNSIPLIDEIGPENYRMYAESGIPLAYLFVDSKVEGQKDTYIERVRNTAQQTKGKLNWVWIDSSKYAKHAEKLGLSGTVVPALAIEEMTEGTHFAFDEKTEITAATVEPWVTLYTEGKLEPTIKSEPIPESNNEPVKVVVAKSFSQIVGDTTKDVLVEFYAPWCGHCKKLAPIWDELAKDLENVPSVVIAKIDATANDVDPKLGIRGFPTIKLFPANNKGTPIEYSGDRSKDDLVKFLQQNASSKFEAPAGSAKDEL